MAFWKWYILGCIVVCMAFFGGVSVGKTVADMWYANHPHCSWRALTDVPKDATNTLVIPEQSPAILLDTLPGTSCTLIQDSGPTIMQCGADGTPTTAPSGAKSPWVQ